MGNGDTFVFGPVIWNLTYDCVKQLVILKERIQKAKSEDETKALKDEYKKYFELFVKMMKELYGAFPCPLCKQSYVKFGNKFIQSDEILKNYENVDLVKEVWELHQKVNEKLGLERGDNASNPSKQRQAKVPLPFDKFEKRMAFTTQFANEHMLWDLVMIMCQTYSDCSLASSACESLKVQKNSIFNYLITMCKILSLSSHYRKTSERIIGIFTGLNYQTLRDELVQKVYDNYMAWLKEMGHNDQDEITLTLEEFEQKIEITGAHWIKSK